MALRPPGLSPLGVSQPLAFPSTSSYAAAWLKRCWAHSPVPELIRGTQQGQLRPGLSSPRAPAALTVQAPSKRTLFPHMQLRQKAQYLSGSAVCTPC